jgi:hypothetical protein
MLSFATEFPVSTQHQARAFLDAIADWITGSPHTRFDVNDLVKFFDVGEWTTKKGNESIQKLFVENETESAAAVRWTLVAGEIEWDTRVVYSKNETDAWVSVRTSRESTRPATRLPPAKKPIVVKTLMNALGGAMDGALSVSHRPRFLKNGEIDLAASLIVGKAGCRLPVVYVSADFSGRSLVDVREMAKDLSGVAHVVVEPNRPFSRRLQMEVDSENVYGGTIGVYWPDGGGRRSFFLGREFESSLEIMRAVIDEIRVALMNRRPLVRCTWSSVQEKESKATLKLLQASGSIEVEKYVEVFDAELKAKNEQISDAESEIARLKAEIRKFENQTSLGSGIALKTGNEHDLFPNEILEIVVDALVDASDRVQKDSRREHVLQSLLKATSRPDTAKKNKDALKEALRGYTALDRKTRKVLEDLGFSITEEGKHYKIVFQGDDRYTFTLSKSGSDHRGGLNAASDISKRLF